MRGANRTGVDPHGDLCAASSTAPTACWQLVEGFMPEGDRLDDAETLTYLHSHASRPGVIACACPRTPMLSRRAAGRSAVDWRASSRALGASHLRSPHRDRLPDGHRRPGVLDEL